MRSKIIIVDVRKELSTKYKKALEDSQTSVTVTKNLKDALFNIERQEPDIIIVSDSINELQKDFCRKLRTLTINTRPVIIALSKSAEISDRIVVLENGADDFISEPVNIEEFKTRVKAHLRRDIESNLDNKTLLPNKKSVFKILKRALNSEEKFATLLISVENLEKYREIYTEVASDKLIQTLVAIIQSTLDDEDFLGQLDDTHLFIITNSFGAEKLANFLTFAFDTIVTKFYSEDDSKRGYMLLKGNRQAGMRVNFVSILIGGIIDNFTYLKTSEQVLEKLYSLLKIAKIPSGSSYAIDRVQITGKNSIQQDDINNKICVIEEDEALSLLIRTTLELQGYDVCENFEDEITFQPKIIIIDTRNDMSGLEVCKQIKSHKNFINTKIIVTSTLHEKTTILNSGADLYLPKPYEISDLIKWVEYLIKN